jgi:hypothetical protein
VGDARPVRWARWASLEEYRAMPMPDANIAIVDALERALGTHSPENRLTGDSSISYK